MNLAVEYLKKQFEIFGITYAKDFVVIHMKRSNRTKILFYPKTNLNKNQFTGILDYLKSNFDMSVPDNYFVDGGDIFIISIPLWDFYRNKILKDILDE
jgi:FMN-dependent NADH-azoreductase